MKFFTLLFLLTVSTFYSQSKKKLTPIDSEQNCKKTNNTSFENLASLFPLNKTTNVQIVSFEYKNSILIEDGKPDELIVIDSLPRIGNKLDYKNLKEFKHLELIKIIELSNILYNFNFDPKKSKTIKTAGCYMPRNAIVFLDNQENIIEYIEICFECGGYFIFNKSNFGEFCDGKIQLVKNFFILNGMEYGLQ
ncbi:hypothetical protein B0A67_18660 [Flavobacterium aquidurense]|uniref:hypothetical protein n=1 Tax=Flavobacterium aquidurense TaxID=362413 RepID=UPI00091C0D76|nr:hypothetical protein [Flavobacterium aquidurense]OXA69735.1 hypothetical protein B0A67_18660 [Flavobacterium aquidurense]SHH27638.1 hypothetical protein SAMN05444481_11467 [Flavobacterium frigidimaris]